MTNFAFGTSRDLVTQTQRTFAVAIVGGAAAVPLDFNGSKQQLITSFGISNPSTSGASVFFGNQGVTDTTGPNPGFEIPAGSAPVIFTEFQEGRQFYELQTLVAQIASSLKCQMTQLEKIPFVVFDLSQYFIFSTASITITVITFPTMYL